MKKLIPALALLLVSAVMLATSSFAWFSMNTSVTVTGMSVTAKVNDNLQIAPTTVDGTAKEADSAFKYGYVMTHTSQLLEPVSTINGVNFFYTSTKNVTASGDAATDTYVAYNHADTSLFDENYGTTGAKGYVEYAVQLKADNASNAIKYVNLKELNITYAGTAADQKAFRVAVFVDDMGADGSTPATVPSTTTLKSILAMTGSAYYTSGKAVNSATTLDSLNGALGVAANIGSVAANNTRYFKVVVRLWLEGEDTTCTNATFASLNQTWDFDLKFQLEDATGGVAVLNQNVTPSKTDISGQTSGAEARVIDGQNYYEIGTDTGLYLTSASTAVNASSIVYSIDTNGIVLDVTNRCTLVTP